MEKEPVERVSFSLPESLAIAIEEARLDLRRRGVRCSASGFAEIALRELLGRRDLVETITRYDAKLRRGSSGRSQKRKSR